MYLLLIVLRALCELVNSGGLAPQLEPVRRTPDEPEGSSGRDKRRSEPSLCRAFDVTFPGDWTRVGDTSQRHAAPERSACSRGTPLRHRRRG